MKRIIFVLFGVCLLLSSCAYTSTENGKFVPTYGMGMDEYILQFDTTPDLKKKLVYENEVLGTKVLHMNYYERDYILILQQGDTLSAYKQYGDLFRTSEVTFYWQYISTPLDKSLGRVYFSVSAQVGCVYVKMRGEPVLMYDIGTCEVKKY